MKVIIIGGGPAGILAAISAKQNNENVDVTILEKMNKIGKKLLITGKGRCNITSSLPMDEFISNVPGNGRFLYSSFQNYTNQNILELLHENGLQTKQERGDRIFPITDKSIDVLNILEKQLNKLGVVVKLNSKVEEILIEEDRVIGVKCNGQKIQADKVILATGGKSYPLTGSNGEGYKMSEKLGHEITHIVPSLVPLVSKEKKSYKVCLDLQGLSLKNVSIKLLDELKGKCIYSDFGEMIFTHFGVSGPTILSGSAHLVRYKNIKELMQDNKLTLQIDLKPALSEEKLDDRILRDFEKYKNKELKNALDDLLPQKLIPVVIQLSEIDPYKRVNDLKREERIKLGYCIKHLEVKINDFGSIDEAIITSGGISIKQINPKTMESKLVKGLYFAGEIIDVDAYTGGFNLQIAYSTGYTAGLLQDS